MNVSKRFLLALCLLIPQALFAGRAVKMCDDVDNIISSRIFGDWSVDLALSAELAPGSVPVTDTINFVQDESREMRRMFSGLRDLRKCAHALGYVTTVVGPTTFTFPFALATDHGVPVVYFLVGTFLKEGYIGWATGEDETRDILFVGNDVSTTAMAAYRRQIEE